MKNKFICEDIDLTHAAPAPRRQFTSMQRAEACLRGRGVCLAFSAWRRKSCLTHRAMLAAMREAELAAWKDSGGDFLASGTSPC